MNQEQYEELVQRHREDADMWLMFCDCIESVMKRLSYDANAIKDYKKAHGIKDEELRGGRREVVKDGTMHLKQALANMRMYRADVTRVMSEDDQMRFGEYSDRIMDALHREYDAIKGEWLAGMQDGE